MVNNKDTKNQTSKQTAVGYFGDFDFYLPIKMYSVEPKEKQNVSLSILLPKQNIQSSGVSLSDITLNFSQKDQVKSETEKQEILEGTFY